METHMTLHEQIQAAEHSLAAAIERSDVAQVIALYTEDARLMPNGQPTLYGKAAIGGFFEQVFRMGVTGARFQVVDVEGRGQEANEIGSYELYARTPAGDPIVVEKGRYLVIWKSVDGKWLLHRDMFNADAGSD